MHLHTVQYCFLWSEWDDIIWTGMEVWPQNIGKPKLKNKNQDEWYVYNDSVVLFCFNTHTRTYTHILCYSSGRSAIPSAHRKCLTG